MIKLTDEQIVQLGRNLSAAIDDLQQAAFESDDQTPLISTGANIGMALQKLYDIRQFLAEQANKETNASMAAKAKHMASQPTKTDEELAEEAAAFLQQNMRYHNL